MSIITIGINLAKNVFAVHGVNESGKAELVEPKVPRDQLLPLIVNLPPCLIGMEACSGAHHWARLFMALLNKSEFRPISRIGVDFLDFYRDWHTQIRHSV